MNSIRRHLVRDLTLVLALLFGTALAAIYLAARFTLVDAFDDSLRARASAVAALTEFEQGRVQFDFSADFLRSFGLEHPHHYFELRDRAGTALARSPSLGEQDLPLRPGGTAPRPVFWNLPLPTGRAGRAIAFTFVPVATDTVVPVEPVSVIVAVDRHRLDERLFGLLAIAAGSGALWLLAIVLVVPRVLRRGLASLERLGRQAAAIDADHLATRFPVADLPAELRPIGETLNALLARLERAFEREHRFSADLAHELRTPIAELRSLAECALKWPEARDPAADEDILAIAQQMEALVARMLTLARGEGGQLAAPLVREEVGPLVAQAWEIFAARAEARRLELTLALGPAQVVMDPVLLRSLLANLFGNAVEHAPAGTAITIRGERIGANYLLRVANPAGELQPDDVARLFDRFWRKEASRTGGEHAGLGLALARSFAIAMGWRLDAALTTDGWLEFVATGPVGAAKECAGERSADDPLAR